MRTEESSLREPSAVDIVWWLAVYSVAPDLNPARICAESALWTRAEALSCAAGAPRFCAEEAGLAERTLLAAVCDGVAAGLIDGEGDRCPRDLGVGRGGQAQREHRELHRAAASAHDRRRQSESGAREPATAVLTGWLGELRTEGSWAAAVGARGEGREVLVLATDTFFLEAGSELLDESICRRTHGAARG